ncbi:SPOR domain-containing protein [Anditalea andensis]|uniref:SPOR domain-containing protein n=1 Tax=Anditalea andensis TaxID=1048983 RepID=A0A074KTI3_9BACT|nr:SPOR domain-containing protein [Anditalea andensis]KEO72199.1 hypothetical protein EL17_20045 [Anditalea andensis]
MAFRTLVLLLFLWFSTFWTISPLMAQMTKQERRTWRKELRKMSPEDLKQIKAHEAEMKEKISALSGSISQLQKELQDKDNQLTALKNEITRLESALKTRNESLEKFQEEKDQWDRGVVFRVQIGAFKDYDFQDAFGSSPNLIYEEDSHWQKYVIGNFRFYDEANKLKKHLRRTGVRDAWIVPYEDGKRVPLKDVLDKVLEQRKK